MRQPVLVALDGSDKDGRAVAVATALGKLAESELHLVRVVQDPLAGVVRDPASEFVGLRAAEQVQQAVATGIADAEAQLARVASTLPGSATQAVIQGNDVAGALLEHAEKLDALVLVLATRAPKARSRALAGSIADRVMRDSPRPVMLVPPGAAFMAGREPTIARVLVPLDDSSLSFRSLEFIIGLPRATSVQYVLIEVVTDDRARATALARLETSAAWLRSRGASAVEVHVLTASNAGNAIVDAIREVLAETIVMSTRGAGGLARLILGSVAEHVVRNSEVPVMLLTPRMLARPAAAQ